VIQKEVDIIVFFWASYLNKNISSSMFIRTALLKIVSCNIK